MYFSLPFFASADGEAVQGKLLESTVEETRHEHLQRRGHHLVRDAVLSIYMHLYDWHAPEYP